MIANNLISAEVNANNKSENTIETMLPLMIGLSARLKPWRIADLTVLPEFNSSLILFEVRTAPSIARIVASKIPITPPIESLIPGTAIIISEFIIAKAIKDKDDAMPKPLLNTMNPTIERAITAQITRTETSPTFLPKRVEA